MPNMIDNAGAALVAERPNIFATPSRMRARDTTDATYRHASGVFTATATPLPGVSLGPANDHAGMPHGRRDSGLVSIRLGLGARLRLVAVVMALVGVAALGLDRIGEPSRAVRRTSSDARLARGVGSPVRAPATPSGRHGRALAKGLTHRGQALHLRRHAAARTSNPAARSTRPPASAVAPRRVLPAAPRAPVRPAPVRPAPVRPGAPPEFM